MYVIERIILKQLQRKQVARVCLSFALFRIASSEEGRGCDNNNSLGNVKLKIPRLTERLSAFKIHFRSMNLFSKVLHD
jgi:hypothetical protein